MAKIKSEDINIYINDFAIRCFRDMADGDYIAARLMYRAKLVNQFLWSAQQAIEKYLKCILLLNRIPAKQIGHDLRSALTLINNEAPFKIILSKPEQDIFDHISDYGANRYLEGSYFISGRELLKLDLLVWHLRQYCRIIDYYMKDKSGEVVHMLNHELQSIKSGQDKYPKHNYILGAKLETILKDKKHPAREGLTWKNFFYYARYRKKISWTDNMFAENAPLCLRPDLIDHIQEYVYLTKDAIAAYTKLALEKSKKH